MKQETKKHPLLETLEKLGYKVEFEDNPEKNLGSVCN